MSRPIIELTNVKKIFGNVTALDGLNLSINQGQIYALLGHNGAGKTTTLRIILGLLRVNGGQVSIFGNEPTKSGEDVRRRTGVLSEENGLYESLTVYENLEMFAEIYKMKKRDYDKEIDDLLDQFQILDKKNSVIKDFSLGMKKKVAIIRTIMHKPELILMDEPTNGLDPVSIQTFHNLIFDLAQKNGTTFVLTTHNLDEVKKICDQITIVRHGKSVLTKNLRDSNLDDIFNTNISFINDDTSNGINIDSLISSVNSSITYQVGDGTIQLSSSDKEVIAKTVHNLCTAGLKIYDISKDQFDLEKVYLQTAEDTK